MEECVKVNSLIVVFSFIFLKIYHGRQENWIRHGQKQYWFSSDKLDWEQARVSNRPVIYLLIHPQCGRLIEFQSFVRPPNLVASTLHKQVGGILSDEQEGCSDDHDMEPDVLAYWIGARYDAVYGEHRWLDGTAMMVKGWGFGRPGTVKGCVDYLDNTGWLWNSHWNCTGDTANFICERSANYTEEATTDSTCMNTTCACVQQHTVTLLVAVCVLGGVVVIAVVVGISFIYWRCKKAQNRKTNSTSKGAAVENVDRYEHLSPTRDQHLQMYEAIHEEKDVQYTYI